MSTTVIYGWVFAKSCISWLIHYWTLFISMWFLELHHLPPVASSSSSYVTFPGTSGSLALIETVRGPVLWMNDKRLLKWAYIFVLTVETPSEPHFNTTDHDFFLSICGTCHWCALRVHFQSGADKRQINQQMTEQYTLYRVRHNYWCFSTHW